MAAPPGLAPYPSAPPRAALRPLGPCGRHRLLRGCGGRGAPPPPPLSPPTFPRGPQPPAGRLLSGERPLGASSGSAGSSACRRSGASAPCCWGEQAEGNWGAWPGSQGAGKRCLPAPSRVPSRWACSGRRNFSAKVPGGGWLDCS